MSELNAILLHWGNQIWRRQTARTIMQAIAISSAALFLYLCAVLLVTRMPLSWPVAVFMPALVWAMAFLLIVRNWYRLRQPRSVAVILERENDDLDLKIRTAMDLMSHRSDCDPSKIAAEYTGTITSRVMACPPQKSPITAVGSLAIAATLSLYGLWWWKGDHLSRKTSQPLIAFSEDSIVFEGGSITIFEPDYTNIPGRTLPLTHGQYQAYPGSRVRFVVNDSRPLNRVWYSQNETELKPIDTEHTGQFTHEFLLLEPVVYHFYLDDHKRGGKTQPFEFKTKRDTEPEIQLKSHTPPGPINALDPLYLDGIVKDDFGIAKLEAIVTWEDGEKRLSLQIPNNQRTHFISKNRWSISDLVPENATAFTLMLEATDNNPINGPGVGQSEALHFELESPDRKHDELMEMARQLLDRMTHVLGDNLDTVLASVHDRTRMEQAQSMSDQIQSGLFQAQSLTNAIISLMREDPYITGLDHDFIREFNNGLIRTFRQRIEIGQAYALQSRIRRQINSPSDIGRLHQQEEVKLEQLTYDLLLQLKMWALMEMQRDQESIEQALDQISQLLENSENMTADELEQELQKMLDQLMAELQEMMASAAQEMDTTLQEFMNQEGLQMQQDQMEQLKQEMMEALRNGDMERVKELMEQFRQMMMNAMSSMQQAMGEMSPEMQQMMADMREMMGLLKEMKMQEEQLQAQTQALRSDIDEKLGGNQTEMSEAEQQQQQDAMARIREILTQLHEKLVDYQNEETTKRILDQIKDLRIRAESEDLTKDEREKLEARIRNAERTLDFIMRDALDQLQDATLKSLDTTERMADLLKQGELTQSLDVGFQLENKLLQGERLSERGVSDEVQSQARPRESFAEAREELYKVMEALQNVKQNAEQRRKQQMLQTNETRQQELARKQESIRQMIDEFKDRVEDSLGGSQAMERLDRIGLSMKNAERKLDGSSIDGGLYHEGEALRQIGEMMEQMQQSMQPGQMRPQFMPGMSGRNESLRGDPVGDVYIPESERVLRDDQLRDLIQRQLQKNFPDNYGKEIKQYYETLMDQ